MVIRKTLGNDLTRRTANVYTLEELPSVSLEQIVGGIVEFAQMILASADHTEDYAEDSCEQIADNVLWKIKLLLEAVRAGQDGSVNSDLVAILALQAGKLAERLNWMVRHEGATRKGIQRKVHEQRAQLSGVEANKKKRRQNFQQVVAQLKKEFTTEQQAILPDCTLARRFKNSGLGGDRVLRGYIKEARERGLIPARPEK